MKRLILLLILSVAFSTAARLATADLTGPTSNPYFVKYTQLNDNGDGKSWGNAKQTIQAAIDQARWDMVVESAPDGQIWVLGGAGAVYYETVWTKGISLYGGFDGTESDRRERKWWRNVTTIDGGNTTGRVVDLDCMATVDGFTIQNGAIGVYVNEDGWVSHNVINNVGTCVDCSSKMGYSCVTNNLLTDFDDYGVYARTTDVRNNTIVGNGSSSSYCGVNGSHGYCINNIVTGCEYATLNCSETTYNDFWGYENVVEPDISGDPLFVNASGWDYRLRYGSPCINAGTDVTLPGELDLDGHPRLQGDCEEEDDCVDIGAYEYGVSALVHVSTDDAWVIEPCQIGQEEVEISASTDAPLESIAHVDMWLDGTLVDPPPAYNPTTELWTYEWSLPCPLPVQIATRVRATDTEGNYAECAETVTLELQESPSVIFVRPEGSCGTTHDGHSWLTAFHSVQDGVDAAADPNDPKDEVWVAAGDYYVHQYENHTLTLADGVAVYGGFEVGQCARAQRDWVANTTKLIGELSAPVVTADSVGSATALDGFTLTHGSGNLGGAVYCTDSSLTIANNTITSNQAVASGGGVYISGNHNGNGPVIDHNVFTYCEAVAGNGPGDGGAIYCENTFALVSDNTITPDAVLGPCLAEGRGGGIYVTGGAPVITRNTITGSTAGTAGGGIYCDSSSARIADNVISDNTSSGNGGGIYVTCESDETDIVNNTLTGNTASSGGGIYVVAGSPNIVNNIVASNAHGIWWAEGLSPDNVSHNDVWNSTNGDYPLGEDAPATDISADPVFQTDGFHISGISPCVAAGNNDFALPEDVDFDGQERIQPSLGVIDIGADEVEIADESCEHIALYPDRVPVRVGSETQVVFTVGVYDSLTHAPVDGRDVYFAITSGEIVSISPDGHTQDTPPWGTTGIDGKVTVTVSPDTSVVTTIVLTAFATSACDDEMLCQSSIPIYSAVGFAYTICTDQSLPSVRDYIDQYLLRIAARYPDAITYSKVDLLSSPLPDLSGYNVIFVAMPDSALSDDQKNALLNFVGSGRQKRVVLVGEYHVPAYGWWGPWNGRLNPLAAALGMTCVFNSDHDGKYDNYDPDHPNLCRVEPNHYLMECVANLADLDTSNFSSVGSAVPVAYILQFETQSVPWILVEDTQSEGSRVAIHDSTMFYQWYDDTWDIVPNMNFRFVYNLCTKFPQ